jgi:hypothetical protein
MNPVPKQIIEPVASGSNQIDAGNLVLKKFGA